MNILAVIPARGGSKEIPRKNLIKIGDHGNSSSRLAPIGKALINEQYVEVHSVEGFVDENQEITVVQIETNKIFVKLKNTK